MPRPREDYVELHRQLGEALESDDEAVIFAQWDDKWNEIVHVLEERDHFRDRYCHYKDLCRTHNAEIDAWHAKHRALIAAAYRLHLRVKQLEQDAAWAAIAESEERLQRELDTVLRDQAAQQAKDAAMVRRLAQEAYLNDLECAHIFPIIVLLPVLTYPRAASTA